MKFFFHSFVENIVMYIGIVIKEIRKQKGFTQIELSDKTNISVRTIQRIENDVVEPSLYSLKRISEILDFDFLSIKNRNSLTFMNRLLGINLKDHAMTTQEKVDIEERLRKIESHLMSIDRTHKRNRKTVRGVLFATGILTVSVLTAWIIWILVQT
jgi:transcriptional regulator with XRE-family HTH domain